MKLSDEIVSILSTGKYGRKYSQSSIKEVLNKLRSLYNKASIKEDVITISNILSNKNKLLETVKSDNISILTKSKMILFMALITQDKEMSVLYKSFEHKAVIKSRTEVSRFTEDFISLEYLYKKLENYAKSSDKNKSEYVLSYLYITIPALRYQDYLSLIISKSDDNKNNLYIPDEGLLIIRKYKTENVYGARFIYIPQEIKIIINDYIKYNNLKEGGILFINNDGNKLTNITIKSRLVKVFGINISCDILRRIWISEFSHYLDPEKKGYKLMSEESKNLMIKLAEIMAHSIDVQSMIYNMSSDNNTYKYSSEEHMHKLIDIVKMIIAKISISNVEGPVKNTYKIN